MMGQKLKYIVVMLVFLLANGHLAESKHSPDRNKGGNNRRTHGSVTKPTIQKSSNTHADLAKLSYPGYNSQPNRPKPTEKPAPAVGWNIPKSQGPPPSYSAANPAGGAKTNIHEAPPPYKPNNIPPPSHQSATNSQPFGSGTNQAAAAGGYGTAGVHHSGSVFRPRTNSTGGYENNSVHTPIQATNTHGVQSSYPQQPVSAGPLQYPSPSGGIPVSPVYYPANVIPPGAILYPAPVQSPIIVQSESSGPGLGTGLIAGALGGAIIGHALTPSGSNKPPAPAAAPAASSGSDSDRIIIINNGPPGSVTTTNADGTTVINNPGAGVAAAPAAVAPAAPAPPPAPVAPAPPAPPVAPVAPAPPAPPVAPAGEMPAPLAPFAAGTFDNSSTPAPAAAPQAGDTPAPALAPLAPSAENNVAAPQPEQPPPGGLMCVPIMVNVTDPADSTKVTQVQQVACYPAPPNPPAPAANDAPAEPPSAPASGAVAVAQPAEQAPVNAVPTQVTPTIECPEKCKFQQAASGANSILGVLTSTVFAFLVAYCMH